MKFLLDTHIFLWFITGDKRLSEKFQTEIRSQDNEVYLSVISLWEIIVKYKLGKLPLPFPPETYIPEQRKRHLIQSIILTENDVSKLSTLPSIHRDPFDRMLICQALSRHLTIVTVDEYIRQYSVKILR
ncbi:Type II toxin-antitoxin system VapC family toxin [Candidatus Magnetomoraceae bacterium gMMP-15]